MRHVAQLSAAVHASTAPKDSARAQSPDRIHALGPVVGQMLRLQKTIGNLAIQRLLDSAAPRTKLAIGRRVGGIRLPRALEGTHTARRDASEQAHGGSESLLQRSDGEGASPRVPGGGVTVIIIAAGFDQTGGDEQLAELLHGSERIRWSPVTKDFERTARDTQSSNIYGARTDDQFFGALQASPGPIGRIIFIGHGASGALGLSPSGGTLNAASVSRWQASIDQQIKPKLAAGATIDLFSCEAGGDEGVMQALAAAFGVCVRGYATALNWCVYSPPDSNVITSRGRWIAGSTDQADPDCDAPEWHEGVAATVPPVQVCP